jgi:DNA replication and repair protein RecF
VEPLALAPSPSLRRPRARRIALADFRSYASLDLRLDARIVAFLGDNGVGKTNLLEALSLFSPGRGLRRAEIADSARIGGSGGWAAALDLDRDDGIAAPTRLGTGVEPSREGETAQRQFRVDRAPAASARVFADHLRVVWLTPQQDGLFLASASERRRFLDRLALAVDPDHATRVNAMERALRQRNRLLEEGGRDARWLDAAERELAEVAVAVAAGRVETVGRLSELIAGEDDAAFPSPRIAVEGEVETRLAQAPALSVEDWLREALRAGRARDAAAGRTLVGPHRSDLAAIHAQKGQPAALCSTGEQKALLVGLTLAHARLVAQMSGAAPLVLLDEIAAHFDPGRRAALFAALGAVGGQVFLTGADPAAFADLPEEAERFAVTPGAVAPIEGRR